MFGKKKLISSGVMFTKTALKQVKGMAKGHKVSRSIIIDAAIFNFADVEMEAQSDQITQSKADRGVNVDNEDN